MCWRNDNLLRKSHHQQNYVEQHNLNGKNPICGNQLQGFLLQHANVAVHIYVTSTRDNPTEDYQPVRVAKIARNGIVYLKIRKDIPGRK